MAKTAIRKVPSQLPFARLYLDDLVEIERLLRASIKDVEIIYEADERLRFSSIDDLAEHGGSSTRFTMSILLSKEHYEGDVLRIYSLLRPSFNASYPLNTEEQWSLFARVSEIFAGRRDKVREFSDKIPYWLLILAAQLCWLVPKIGNALHVSTHVAFVIDVLSLIYGSFWLLIVFGAIRRSRIHFSYVREQERERNKGRKEWIGKLGWAVLGVMLTLLTQLISSRFKR